MNAGHLQAQLAEETPIGDGVAGRIAEGLDASVTGRGHFAHNAFKIIGELGAQRIELQGERRDFVWPSNCSRASICKTKGFIPVRRAVGAPQG